MIEATFDVPAAELVMGQVVLAGPVGAPWRVAGVTPVDGGRRARLFLYGLPLHDVPFEASPPRELPGPPADVSVKGRPA